MGNINVLVIMQSGMVLDLLIPILADDSEIQVIGIADSGAEGLRLVKQLQPDVVLLGMDLPDMSGCDALLCIMDEQPIRIVMISSGSGTDSDSGNSTQSTQSKMEETVKALQSGAVDFISAWVDSEMKMFVDDPVNKLLVSRTAIQQQVKSAARTPLSAHIAAYRSVRRQDEMSNRDIPARVRADGEDKYTFHQIILIGAAVGGPKALETVLMGIPDNFPYPILIVQHLPSGYTKALAHLLDKKCRIRVVEAIDGEKIQGGTAYIAPGHCHMILTKERDDYKIELNQDAPVNGHCPSVDVLFNSAAGLPGLKKHVVLLTGEGADGAGGMANAKRQGATSTIVQTRETCVKSGMVQTAVDLQCVDYVLPLTIIAPKLRQLTANEAGVYQIG